jgi:hypothetical protein
MAPASAGVFFGGTNKKARRSGTFFSRLLGGQAAETSAGRVLKEVSVPVSLIVIHAPFLPEVSMSAMVPLRFRGFFEVLAETVMPTLMFANSMFFSNLSSANNAHSKYSA